MNHRPTLLIIMDGYGISDNVEGNAIANANTPILDKLFSTCPYSKLIASGVDVGLPEGQMGNSEVGHINIGAGRIVLQDLLYINNSIQNKSFYKNEKLIEVMKYVSDNNSTLHLMGLVSDGGVHSSLDHIYALLKLASNYKLKNVNIHVWTDGRDTLTCSALKYISELEMFTRKLGIGEIKTICGRFYSMDRDERWERTIPAYEAVFSGKGETFKNTIELLEKKYELGETDEFIKPSVKIGYKGIQPNDAIICFNFRADRVRQITKLFLKNKDFNSLYKYVCFCEYDKNFNADVAFKPNPVNNTIGEHLANCGLKQLRVAETEKYAHVTFFLNAGVEKAYQNEERILINSPKVERYDSKPEMSADQITESVINSIRSGKYDFIVVNYANADMVGHTGNMRAAIQAVEKVDKCIGRLISCIKEASGVAIITADHGNAEKMINSNGEVFTSHTCNPVPFSVFGYKCKLKPFGVLCDIAPTILDIMGIKKPAEMTGNSLII